MKKIITLAMVVILLVAMAVPAFASWETHEFTGQYASVTRTCSYASLTATYSDAFKELESSDGYYDSSNNKKAIYIDFPTTKSRTVTAYVSSGGGTLGIAS